jgi:hypothetical protein
MRLPKNNVATKFREIDETTVALFIAGDATLIENARANAASSAPIQQLYRQAIAHERASGGASIAAPPDQVLGLCAWFALVTLALTTEPFFVAVVQDAGVSDLVRKRKLAHEDLEFQERVVVHHQKQLDHAFSLKEKETRLSFSLKEKETRLSFEVGGNDVALKKEEFALKEKDQLLKERDFALKEKHFALKEKHSALNEKDMRLSVEIDEKKLALKQKEIAMQQKCKTSHKAKPQRASAAAVAMPMSRAVPTRQRPSSARGQFQADRPVLVPGTDKSFFYAVPKP